MIEEQLKWDARYSENPNDWNEPENTLPELYTKFVAPLFPKPTRAIDYAGGAGRNSLWLARQGWQVKLVDVSTVALSLAQQRFAQAGLTLQTQQVNLDVYEPPVETFDLALVIYFMRRPLFPRIAASLRPGGILFYKTHTAMEGPGNERHYLMDPGELRTSFPQLEVLDYQEFPGKRGLISQLVARRPVAG